MLRLILWLMFNQTALERWLPPRVVNLLLRGLLKLGDAIKPPEEP